MADRRAPAHQGFGSWRHLAARFVGAVDPRGPAPGEEEWATSWLLAGEQDLWRRMSGPDRRHAAAVARDTERRLGRVPGREVMAAALLHDVGKVESGLGTFARVAVTLAAMVAGRDRLTRTDDPARLARAGRAGPGPERAGPGRPRTRARVASYLEHDRIGAELCVAAGSDAFTVAWAREHHRPAASWSVERPLGDALKAADGD